MQNEKNQNIINKGFELVSLRLASPEKILDWSNGEITKPETINYRTQRSEKQGLFDEKIFGPERDYECYCGKYKGVRYKGIICEKCGVELTRAIVRRERMGHIELASPVSHIWFLRNLPSRLGTLLSMTISDLEKVIYFAGYIVISVSEEERSRFLKELDNEYKNKLKGAQDDKTKEALSELIGKAKKEIESIQLGMVFDELTYHKFSIRYGTIFEATIGGEAIYNILKNLDLIKLEKELSLRVDSVNSSDREKFNKRLSLIRSMIKSGIKPEWMFLIRIPVIPPGIRPMVALEGGRFATSDINDLYRRVINRNNRLLKLKEINAPDVILRNEKRILQEAVDALLDNSIRQGNSLFSSVGQSQKRQLKSMSDNLKGKHGLFRQNLLGKRVDYSGRSVIVVGPELNLDQCGVPKHMALELFKPFVISKILVKELAFNIRGANKLIEEGVAEVWAMLEDVIKEKYVLLNRAPTLHRLSIQAFRPVLIEGNAIRVHPLVCRAFNADFDGDQMAIHVPLSEEAQMEAREIMASNKNILKPGSGDPTVSGKMLDVVLGTFWMTKIVEGEKGEGKYFESPSAAINQEAYGNLGYRAKIKVMNDGSKKYSEMGAIFETTVGRIMFNNVLPEDYMFINKEIDQKRVSLIIDDISNTYGLDIVPSVLDRIKTFGFTYVTRSGVTWGIDDVKIPEGKHDVISKAKIQSQNINNQYNDGLLTEEEKIRKNIEIWHKAKNEIEKMIPASLDKLGSVYDMVNSGARGSISQITQMAGMKGLIQNTAGETIELPVISCSKEGFTPIEYFITTHGARKGMSDTALNTAKAGYLTRKLFVVAQDLIVREEDCGTKEGIKVLRQNSLGVETPLSKSVKGRVLSSDVEDKNGNTIFKTGHLLSKQDVKRLDELVLDSVFVRSPMSCLSKNGVCANCYGMDLGKYKKVELGEAIGTVAAQAIGEPGTQLTMRTFHAGGTASVGGDITSGLPRVEEVFEKRNPKNPALISTADGMISDIRDTGKDRIIVVSRQGEKPLEFSANYKRMPIVKVGDLIKRGDFLTDGSASIDELFKLAGKEVARNYVISEASKIYELQGEPVDRKHIEVIVKQMFSRVKIKDPGTTALVAGDIVDQIQLDYENNLALENKGEMAKFEPIAMGISEISLSRKSWLSAASFQNTSRILINTAVRGGKDSLSGLMENVIIGRLIPSGSGFVGSPKYEMIAKMQRDTEEKIDSKKEEVVIAK